MPTILRDLRLAFRQLRATPGFALLAILTLAFGVGANTAMFTVVESVLLRPLPYAHADFVFLWTQYLRLDRLTNRTHLGHLFPGSQAWAVQIAKISCVDHLSKHNPEIFKRIGKWSLR
jgi:hypothetical protein